MFVLKLHTDGLDPSRIKIYQRIFGHLLSLRMAQYKEFVATGKPVGFKWITGRSEQHTIKAILAKSPNLNVSAPELALVLRQLDQGFKVWRKDTLSCAQCGKPVPKTHSVYRVESHYILASTGKNLVFCDKRCGMTWRHANLATEQKEGYHNKIATTRKNRTPKQKAESAARLSATWSKFSKDRVNEITKRRHQTTLEKGGYSAIVAKRESSLIEKHGAGYGKKRHKKYVETCTEKYGKPNTLCGGTQSRAKAVATTKERFGVEVATKNKEVASKMVATYVKNNGGMGRASESSNAKYLSTMLGTFGVVNPAHDPVLRAKATETFKRVGAKKSLETKRNNGTLPAQVSWKGHETKKINGSYSTSKPEQYILQRLRALLGPQVVHLYRGHPNYIWEADFYDPLSGTIFEYQGFPSHGTGPFVQSNKEHRKILSKLKNTPGWLPKLTTQVWAKTDPKKRATAKENNIPFVEWYTLSQFSAWYEEQIASLVGASHFRANCYKVGSRLLVAHDSKLLDKATKKEGTIVFYPWDDLTKVARLLQTKSDFAYARKTDVVSVDRKEADAFCNSFHLQGACRGTKFAVGLRSKDTGELVGLMTFGKPRYNKNYDSELLRLCFSRGVVGGSQKMWKFALPLLQEQSVISYCDNSKFDGEVYGKLGFEKKTPGRAGRHWYNSTTGKRISDNLLRQRGFDQLLGNKMGTTYGKGTSNEALMRKHGFVSVLDRGQAVFAMNNMSGTK